MLGRKKNPIPFGQRKNKGTFGEKKPFKGTDKNRKGSKKRSGIAEDRETMVNRIKPRFNGKNVNGISELEREFLEWLQEQEEVCFCCGKQNGIEWHHVKLYSTDKKDHARLIPLCGVECHRLGQELSAHGTPKKWRETFSIEMQLGYAKVFYDQFLTQKG